MQREFFNSRYSLPIHQKYNNPYIELRKISAMKISHYLACIGITISTGIAAHFLWGEAREERIWNKKINDLSKAITTYQEQGTPTSLEAICDTIAPLEQRRPEEFALFREAYTSVKNTQEMLKENSFLREAAAHSLEHKTWPLIYNKAGVGFLYAVAASLYVGMVSTIGITIGVVGTDIFQRVLKKRKTQN